MEPRKIVKNLSIGNARIGFRNFSGKEGQYNAKGKRNFCVFLDKEVAKDLKDDGWNVRVLQPRDPEDEPQAYMQVSVAFDFYPPKIVVITDSSKTELSESAVNVLDWAEIESVDLIIRPYNWKMASGKFGVKAYVKAMYIKIVEDEFANKYKNVPDSAAAAILDDQPPWED